ncbi:MAG: PASTA domain-containing protein [Acidobacteriota bacterium]
MGFRLDSGLVKQLLRGVLLAVIFLGSAFAVMYFALRGRSVEVPNVIGKTEEAAMEALDDAGLRMKIKGRAHSDKIEADLVSDQSPAPGTVIKTGQLVRISISMGAPPPPPTPTPTPKPTPEASASPDESPAPKRKPSPEPTPSDVR